MKESFYKYHFTCEHPDSLGVQNKRTGYFKNNEVLQEKLHQWHKCGYKYYLTTEDVLKNAEVKPIEYEISNDLPVGNKVFAWFSKNEHMTISI